MAVIIRYKKSGKIHHCDESTRYYEQEKYNARLRKHIKANEVAKAEARIKIFVSNPSLQDFINLVTTYFVWNDDVFTYFFNHRSS